jgi:hypothetical protein
MMTADLLSRARAGDGEAFRELTGPHRRELQVHCYRMLGSILDAEDAVQETMLAAWRGIGGFAEERASPRTWLYQFAAGRRYGLVPTRANGQPAFGVYLRGPAGIRHAAAFYVLTLAGGQICGMTRFEASVLPWFGLPRSLPGRQPS